MIAEKFLNLLVCPNTKQALHKADPSLFAHLKEEAREGTLKTVDGRLVGPEFDEILVRQDRRVGYLVKGGIPILLPDEGLELDLK